MARKYETIDDYICSRTDAVVPTLGELRDFVHDTLPGATEGMQYGAPVFINAYGVPVIYLFGSKAHVNFGFLKGAELNDPDGVLKGSGKPSKHVRVLPDKTFDRALLADFIKQCEGMKPDRQVR